MSRLKLSIGRRTPTVPPGCTGPSMHCLATLTDDHMASDLWQFFLTGLSHHQYQVRRQFQQSVRVARQAADENANDIMITASLLCFPCHMLSSRRFSTSGWDSDGLIETGTLDWLLDLFGEEVAEVVRLQPHCRRYLASINQSFAGEMDSVEQEQLIRDGGEMSLEAKFAFARVRYFSQAMQLSRWIHQSSLMPSSQWVGTAIVRATTCLPCKAISTN